MSQVVCTLCFQSTPVAGLMIDGWGVTWDVCRPCYHHEALRVGEVPCPTCQLRYGFHDRELHAARVTIPSDKIIRKGSDG